MRWSFDNFRKGPLTTVVGVLLMAAAVYVFVTEEDAELFSLTLLGLGSVAFGLKDPKLPHGPGAAALLALLLLSGCVTYQACFDKYGHLAKDTVRVPVQVVLKDTITVVTQPDSLIGRFSLDSLMSRFDSVVHISSSRLLQATFWRDKYNNIRYRIDVRPDTITKIQIDTVQVVVGCPPAAVFDPEKDAPWHSRLWKNFQFFAAWALLLLIVVLLARHLVNRLTP